MCLDKIFGSDPPAQAAPAPAVVREAPKADDARIEAEATVKAAEEKGATKRRRKYQSLLATGGAGDATSPEIGTPTGKATLGA